MLNLNCYGTMILALRCRQTRLVQQCHLSLKNYLLMEVIYFDQIRKEMKSCSRKNILINTSLLAQTSDTNLKLLLHYIFLFYSLFRFFRSSYVIFFKYHTHVSTLPVSVANKYLFESVNFLICQKTNLSSNFFLLQIWLLKCAYSIDNLSGLQKCFIVFAI